MTGGIGRIVRCSTCAAMTLIASVNMAWAGERHALVPGAGVAMRAATPDATARSFYVWYVGLMARDLEPGDDRVGYDRYVSTALRSLIARRSASVDGMDVDYFIKAQDYLDDWVGHVSATPATMRGDTARTFVTLGKGTKGWRLAVVLVRENRVWKIGNVTRA